MFIIYFLTMAPSVVEIDAGELATAQATLGIAHPTGYPLFTMIGYLFSLIHMPFSKIFQLNLLAAFWCSLGVGLFAYSAKLILDNLDSFGVESKNKQASDKKNNRAKNSEKDSHSKKQEIPESKKYLAAIFSALILAFDKTYWAQSTSVEVYSLQVFLFILIIFFSLKAYLKKDLPENISIKSSWLWVALALALGFSNHMTTLFILPGLAYIYFNKYKFNKKSFIRIGIMLSLFIPVLVLIYSYLPIRSAQNPILNWGNPTNFSALFRHVEGTQYKVWLFSSTEAAVHQLKYFLFNLPDELKVSLFIILVGFVIAFILARKIFIFGIITFLFTVLYSINYDIKDIDSYFLLGYIVLSIFGIFGIVQLFSILKAKRYNYLLPAGLIIIFLAVEFFLNFKEVNQRDVFTFEDYTKSVLNYSSKNSIILSYEWDYLVSPSYYFQYVEKYRHDVTIIDKELLRRSWYYKQLNNNHPKLFAGMHEDVNAFIKAVAPFEDNGNFNPNLLEALYRKILRDIVATNINKRDIYIAPELFDNEMQKGEFSLPQGYTIVPDVLMFKVVRNKSYIPAADPNFLIRFPSEKNQYTNVIENLAGSMLARRALYEMQFDNVDRAKLYIRKIKKEFPDYILPQGLNEVLGR